MCNLQVLTTDCFSSIGLPLRSLQTWSGQATEALVFLAACVEHAYIRDTQILSPNTIPQAFFLALFCLASVYSSIPGKPGSKMSTQVLICFTLRHRGNSFRIMEPAILRKTNQPTKDAQVAFSRFPQIRMGMDSEFCLSFFEATLNLFE